MDYTRLAVAEIRAELDALTLAVRAEFGSLDSRRFNWCPRPDAWSVGQCIEHLVKINHEMSGAIAQAADPTVTKTIWQRLPVWSSLFGSIMVRSMTPTATRKLTAPATTRPSASQVDLSIIDRFVDGQHDLTRLMASLADRDLARLILVSPFARIITYSVLDAFRLIVAHEHRHLQQARRVMATPGYPT